MQPQEEHPHVPGPSVWPVGFAVGVVVLLVGLIISWYVAGLGALIALVFGFLWVRDLTAGTALAHAPAVEPEERVSAPPLQADVTLPEEPPVERYPRSKFLEIGTLGLGGVIGGLVTVPALGFMIAPPFLNQGTKDHDIGPLTDFPQGKYVIATWTSDKSQGEVSRRTAFVRYNGELNNQPSFTIISNHCAHLGCPVQPNGEVQYTKTSHYNDVTLIPVTPSGFGCPCHGGQYDTEGNRTAGPPVRALDRYSFSIIDGHLYVGKPFSVSHVVGTGAQAKIYATTYSFPGEHVTGLESWLYPLQPPHA